MKKISLLAFLLIFFLSWCSSSSTNNCEQEVITEINPNSNSLYLEDEEKDIIICDLNYWFSAIASKDFDNDTTVIKFDWPSKSNANIQIVITGLLWDNPRLKWNAWETDLVKLDNWDTIYLIETTWAWNLVIWTYYPEMKTLSMTKQYAWFVAYSSLAMWFCK